MSDAKDAKKRECSAEDVCFVCGHPLIEIKQKRVCVNCRTINQTCCD